MPRAVREEQMLAVAGEVFDRGESAPEWVESIWSEPSESASGAAEVAAPADSPTDNS